MTQAHLYGVPKPSQLLVRHTGFIKVAESALQIFGIFARLPLTMSDEINLRIKIERTGILMMLTVNDKAQGLDTLQTVIEHHIRHALDINRRHLLTRLQIGPCFSRLCGFDAKSDTTARTARIQSEDKTRLLRCATMDMAVNTKSAMIAMQPRWSALGKLKSRPPHQRAISKHPQILHLNVPVKPDSLASP